MVPTTIEEKALKIKTKYNGINFNEIAENLEFENDTISSNFLMNEKCMNLKGKNLEEKEIKIIRLLAKAHESTRLELQRILCNVSKNK